ncbi:Hypothetical predicted protein [Cloeon dipterum]|uniref:Uncharacterized protein n=1 Tax=Cloeon dipterum TaxID=197152 RepID=A0A8S1E009_9INSE|nr:Hypothetical predicted protein [Cloeon dipterum]
MSPLSAVESGDRGTKSNMTLCEIDFVDFNQAGVKMDETKKLRNSEFRANKKMKCLNCGEELSNANYSGHVCMKDFVDFNQAGVKMDETKKLRNSEIWANMKMKCLNCQEELSNANNSGHVCMKLNDIIICPFPNCHVHFVGLGRKEMSEKHMNEVHELKGNLECEFSRMNFERFECLARILTSLIRLG